MVTHGQICSQATGRATRTDLRRRRRLQRPGLLVAVFRCDAERFIHPFLVGHDYTAHLNPVQVRHSRRLTYFSRALTAWTSSNVLAGSDTTAIFLRTMFKNLIDHPESLGRLRRELDDAATAGRLSEIVTWKESRGLPYLEACFKETGRIHPPFGLQLERIVPSGGVELSRQHLPAGTIVGMNAWAVHRDADIFGADADCWRPERWLECDEETRSRMERGLLTVSTAHIYAEDFSHLFRLQTTDRRIQFGAGHRSCLGKHISYLEIYKLVPTILRKFDVCHRPRSPEKVWKTFNFRTNTL